MATILVMRQALVTGGGRGIGLATCRRLLAAGYEVAAISRSADDLAVATAQIGSTCFHSCAVDVRDVDAVRAVVAAAAGRGPLRAAVLAHGVYPDPLRVADTDRDAFAEVTSINLTGAFVVAREVVRAMSGGGVLVLVGSANGYAAEVGQVAYNASKAAVHSLVQSIAVDHARDGIRAVGVAPGWVRTRMTEGSITPEMESGAVRYNAQARVAEPDEIAALIAWLCSDDASFLTGSTVTADGGQLAEAPGPWVGPA